MTDDSIADSGDSSYQETLGTTLRRRDRDALRAFLIDKARRFGDENQVESISSQSNSDLDELMHRMILARADLADMHSASSSALGMNPAVKKQPKGPRQGTR